MKELMLFAQITKYFLLMAFCIGVLIFSLRGVMYAADAVFGEIEYAPLIVIEKR